MTTTFHLLTGEYPPQSGGVGDYTCLVAHALAARGAGVHVWCPTIEPAQDSVVHLHRLPDVFGAASRRMLESALASNPGCVLLQYVPNPLGARGANLPLCLWLKRLRRRRVDVRVMFHEPYFYFSWRHPLGNVLAAIQRAMAAVLLRASAVAYVSTATWGRYLLPWSPAGTTLVPSPMPATVPLEADPQQVGRWRARFARVESELVVGHFGTFGVHVARELERVIPAVLDAVPGGRFVCIGRGAESFTASLHARHPELKDRITATGMLPGHEISAALRACDVVVQPYPDGVTTRRTSVMAALANEVAVVTTDGDLTEAVWRETGAVALAPAGDVRAIAAATAEVLRDRRSRTALAAGGRRAYDAQFALEHAIDALVSAPAVGA